MRRPPVRLVEVGPRDGLQNEAAILPAELKVRFVDALSAAGLREIEAGAFVSPGAVPQMADSEEVFEGIRRKPGVAYSALVPNERGLERALAAEVDKVAVFTAASETFNQRNIRASVAEAADRCARVVARALAARLPVRGYVSTAFYCPYEGRVAVEKAVDVAKQLLDIGVDEVSLGDTIGRAVPDDVRALLAALLKVVAVDRVFLHFHDTYGTAVANALTAWSEFGVPGFDSSAGGLGGCPFAPGAGGNVATEDLLYAFAASGSPVGVDIGKVVEAARLVEGALGRPLASRLSKARYA